MLSSEHCFGFDLWHDRAVFHFLTNEKDQQTYIQKLKQYLKPNGYFLLSTFAPTIIMYRDFGININNYQEFSFYPLGNFSSNIQQVQKLKQTNDKHTHSLGYNLHNQKPQ
jgi:hypothetical protein